jgi:hypothetical protein
MPERPKYLPGALPDLLVTLSPLLALRIGGALVLLLIWAQLALAAKRFHDVGKAGWSCLLLFVPLVGLIAFIYLLFARGEDRDNQYGPGRSAPSAGTRPAWRSFGWCRDDALDETGLLPGRSGAQFGPTAWVELNTLVEGVRPAPYFRCWHYPEGPRRRNICDSYLGHKRRASVGPSTPLSWLYLTHICRLIPPVAMQQSP